MVENLCYRLLVDGCVSPNADLFPRFKHGSIGMVPILSGEW